MKIDKFSVTEFASDKDFCVLPFTSVQVGTTFLSPCCKTTASDLTFKNFRRDFNRYINSPTVRYMKQEFLDGRKPPMCNKCFLPTDETALYPAEKGKELQTLIKKFGVPDEIDTDDSKFLTLNFTLSSTCNLACRMCVPSSSSTLNKLWDEKIVSLTGIGKIPVVDMLKENETTEEFLLYLIDHEKFRNLASVALSGGEPLMHKNLINWVTKLHDKGVKKITIVTNAAADPFNFYDAFSNLSESTQKCSTISVDGPPAVQQYVRQGIDVASFEQTVGNIVSKGNLSLCVTFSPSALNMHAAADTLKYVLKLFGKSTILRISFVENGYLSFKVLPRSLKLQVLADLKRGFSEINPEDFKDPAGCRLFMSTIIDYISADLGDVNLDLPDTYSPHFFEFVDYTRHLDSIHNTDICSIFPQIRSYLEVKKP